jgi:hypothetical protein
MLSFVLWPYKCSAAEKTAGMYAVYVRKQELSIKHVMVQGISLTTPEPPL